MLVVVRSELNLLSFRVRESYSEIKIIEFLMGDMDWVREKFEKSIVKTYKFNKKYVLI